MQSARGAALCVTGQLRSAPLAHQSWSDGPVHRLLGSADTYVVTSSSNSYGVWKSWLDTVLRPQGSLVTHVGFDLLETADPWSHRLRGSRLQFNMRYFPRHNTTKKLEAKLVQLAHAWHCARLVEEGM